MITVTSIVPAISISKINQHLPHSWRISLFANVTDNTALCRSCRWTTVRTTTTTSLPQTLLSLFQISLDNGLGLYAVPVHWYTSVILKWFAFLEYRQEGTRNKTPWNPEKSLNLTTINVPLLLCPLEPLDRTRTSYIHVAQHPDLHVATAARALPTTDERGNSVSKNLWNRECHIQRAHTVTQHKTRVTTLAGPAWLCMAPVSTKDWPGGVSATIFSSANQCPPANYCLPKVRFGGPDELDQTLRFGPVGTRVGAVV